MKQQLAQFWNDEEGATAIEYGLIAGLIAVVIIAGVTAIGTDLEALFQSISGTLKGAIPGGGATPTPP
ncbi:MAG: Flp family type IVb pilin [Burkholderiaceae bacterium]|nr:Flp family type IVb pilin [Burkholderiaceae bacterium]